MVIETNPQVFLTLSDLKKVKDDLLSRTRGRILPFCFCCTPGQHAENLRSFIGAMEIFEDMYFEGTVLMVLGPTATFEKGAKVQLQSYLDVLKQSKQRFLVAAFERFVAPESTPTDK